MPPDGDTQDIKPVNPADWNTESDQGVVKVPIQNIQPVNPSDFGSEQHVIKVNTDYSGGSDDEEQTGT